MNSSTLWDVIIAGGGPAGALSGYHLAKSGLRVAILDYSRFPREKACGGGIQLRAEKWIPFDWSEVIRSTITSAEFSYQFGNRFGKANTSPIVHCVLRTEFDQYLLRKAEQAGVRIMQGVRVNAVTNDGSGATVITSAGTMRARYVIGADGANSVVRKTVTDRSDFFWQVALYSEFSANLINLDGLNSSAIRIDFGSLPSGYAWVFPKKDKVNIGVGCPTMLGKHLRNYLGHFLMSEGMATKSTLQSITASGHQLPTLMQSAKLAAGNLFLVGDAAGLVEPLTGEGISYACHSAHTAAYSIMENFDRPEADAVYRQVIQKEIGDDLQSSRRILSMSVSFPKLFYSLIRNKESVWRLFCEVLRGEKRFQQLHSEILGPLCLAQYPIDYVARKIEQKKLLVARVSDILSEKVQLYGRNIIPVR